MTVSQGAVPRGVRRARPQVAVSGGGSCPPAVARQAEALGTALADLGVTVVCGGLGGVMEAVARGVRRGAGLVVGVLPGYDRHAGNRHLDAAIPTGLGHRRNVIVAASGDALIALPGGLGTLSEIAFALRLGRPVVGLGAWGEIAGVTEMATVPAVVACMRATLRYHRTSAVGQPRRRTTTGASPLTSRTSPGRRGRSPDGAPRR